MWRQGILGVALDLGVAVRNLGSRKLINNAKES